MYLKNSRNSSKLEGYSPLQLTCNLTGMKPAIDYNYYAKRCEHYAKPAPQPHSGKFGFFNTNAKINN